MAHNPTDLQVEALPNGSTVTTVQALRPDGVHPATIMRPDGQTFTVVYLPHGFDTSRLSDIAEELAPGCPISHHYPLARDPEAPAEMLALWDYVVVFDTTRRPRGAEAAA
ncbi:hypothetical protein [Spirillospora sp. NPDC029432]|uniref:hypothetical protein n=1 Tax=Spirillospora sp. NPDC029432 TaxID=3154599 RepID=UPI0034520565